MKKTYIIAELGNTHDGSFGTAKQMIRAAADCGADAVKIQTHIFHSESLADAPNPPYFRDESREEYFERTSFTFAQLTSLKDFAERHCSVDFLSSPFSIEAVELLEKLNIPVFKIPSGEITNLPLIERVAATGRKVLLSSGMSTWAELDAAVKTLELKDCKDFSVLQCTSSYPCHPCDAGLNLIEEISARYGVEVGFSDHTMGVAIPLAAVALGAKIIEKHFTLSRLMYGSDAKNSMEPEEFQKMVEGIRAVETSIATKVNKDESAARLQEMKAIFEKSVVSVKEISKGEILTCENIAVKKPGDGISASYFSRILGKKAKRAISSGKQLTRDDVEGFQF